MEITTFLRETYRNLPRANRPIGSRFLEPRVSQMWGIGASSESRPPPTRIGGDHLLSAAGNSGAASSNSGGRRWSAVAQSVASTNQVAGTPSSLAVTSQQSAFAHQTSTLMSPTDNPMPVTSAAMSTRANTSTVTSANSGVVASVETRRISFVIQDDVESITSSQTTLAVQVNIGLVSSLTIFILFSRIKVTKHSYTILV